MWFVYEYNTQHRYFCRTEEICRDVNILFIFLLAVYNRCGAVSKKFILSWSMFNRNLIKNLNWTVTMQVKPKFWAFWIKWHIPNRSHSIGQHRHKVYFIDPQKLLQTAPQYTFYSKKRRSEKYWRGVFFHTQKTCKQRKTVDWFSE